MTETRPGDQPAHAPVERMDFLMSMRAIPGTVAIIASTDETHATGMAATAWSSLSADPPTVLVCVNQSASVHGVIGRAGAFSLNVVPVGHEETVAIFSAQRGLEGRDRFNPDHWTQGAHGMPVLDDAVVSYECNVVARHDHHTHSIFVGEIQSIGRKPDTAPTVHVDGGFGYVVPVIKRD